MKPEQRLGLVRFHLLDVLAWADHPDWNNAAWPIARVSLLELRRLLAIGAGDILDRQAKHGIDPQLR